MAFQIPQAALFDPRERGERILPGSIDLNPVVSTGQVRGSGRSEDTDMREFDRVTRDPAVMGGKACIRGMRVTVGMIVNQIGEDRSIDELLADFPYLERTEPPRPREAAA